MYAIVGPSGSGKSTLMKVISGRALTKANDKYETKKAEWLKFFVNLAKTFEK